MAGEWVESTLGEIVDFTPKRTIKKGSIAPFVAMADLQENYREIINCEDKEYKGGGSRFINGDTLFARITPCLENGKTAKASNIPEGLIAHGSTEFIIMAAKIGNNDQDFIYYMCRDPDFRKFAESRMEGTSGRQRVSWQSLKDYPIFLPSPDERKSIGSLLGTLDDKIELNRRMNETLEGMAQALFKSWFVDFDPVIDNALAAGNPIPEPLAQRTETRRQAIANGTANRETAQAFPASFRFTEELGWIPEGWEESTLGKHLEIKRGGSPRPIHDFLAPEGLPWVKIADATSSSSRFLFGTKEFIKPEGLKKTILLDKGSLILSNSATPGLPMFLELDACIHDGWLHFPKISQFTKNYLYQLFLIIREELVRHGSGSVFTNLKTDILKEWKVTIPSNEILETFDNWMETNLVKLRTINYQSQTLAKLRDVLLPKLISGELRIPQAEKMVEDAVA